MESTKLGAELLSFKVEGEEKIHQGEKIVDEKNNVYWKRHFPILFPIVGKLINNETIINGEKFKMGQHGFARDLEFKEILKEENIHSYLLKSNQETKKKYPFDFELTVTYEKENDTLTTIYKVKNIDSKQISFGIGGHPALKIDKEKLKNNSYYLEFDEEERSAQCYHLIKGLLDSNPIENKLEDFRYLPISEHTFDDDAIIIKGLNIRKVSLKDRETNKKIFTVDFKDFPFLGIWSKPGAPFICIEPWLSTADKIDSKGNFEEKDLIKTNPNEEFKCEYKIEFYK